MISNYIGVHTIIFLILLLASPIIIQIKWKLFSNYLAFRKPTLQFITFSIALFVLNAIPFQSFDEITVFSKSIQNWYRVQTIFPENKYENISGFPYVKFTDTLITTTTEKRLPSIFIIAIESFNANYVERRSIYGREIMPFFDSLIKKGIYIKHFYGNSVITDKGHLAILFSILPSFRKTVFEDYSSDNFKSLAQIFNNLGYRTVYFQAGDTKSLEFGNEGTFLSKNGFEICKGTQDVNNQDRASFKFKKTQNESGFGGFKDYVLYQQFFNTIDSLHNNSQNKEQRFFGFLATISSHSPWLREKKNPILPYPQPNKVEEDYANVLFHVDSYLRIFFNEFNKRKYLKNSIIIITGDHGQPVNEHGNICRGVGHYEENFRTPFLMIWKNFVKPERIKYQTWSQLDIAPTILDLLNIKVRNHFIGKSFLSNGNLQNHIVYLIQPFDGLSFCLVNFPFKYDLYVPTNKESLYNLEEDPLERNNLSGRTDEFKRLKFFRKRLYLFGLNEYLLKNNRIWNRL